MHTRERGAAHVNIFFFLIIFVLFLGSLGFAYVTLEDNKKLEGDIAQARSDAATAKGGLLIYQHYVEDLVEVIGCAGEYKGKNGFNYEEFGEPDPIKNAALPELIEKEIADFARQLSVPDTKGLNAFFGNVKSSFDGLNKRVADLDSERTQLQANIATLNASAAQAASDRSSEVATLNATITQNDAAHQTAIDEKDALMRRTNASYNQARSELTAAKETHAADVLALNKEAELLKARIDAAAQKTKLINPPQQSDGMILEASQAAGLAWVNLGRNDMLPVGTRFSISAPGADEPKAWGEVTTVEKDRAQVRVTGLKDRFDPVVRGDEVRNDLYSPNVRRNIYLMGRFSHPYSKPFVKKVLENLGNTVTDEVGPGVDLVLVGQDTINEDGSGFTPVTESDEYKQVLFLGIEVASLHKMRDFLKVSGE